MDDRFERVITLFKKAYVDALAPDEAAELEGFLANRHLREVYGEWMEHGLLREVYGEWMEHELLREGLAMEELFPHRQAFKAFKRRVGWRRVYRRRLRVASAVAATLLLASSLFLLMTPAGEEAGLLADNASTIIPGHRQARIRLAGGGEVAVAERDVAVEERGDTRITYEEGKIRYSSGQSSGEPIFNELIVPVGGECDITFDDGTRAWVNADTRIVYPVKFVGGERRVQVEGEAYFEVQPGARPFVVQTRLGDITALGTTFAVKAYREEEVRATLLAGRIRYSGFCTVELSPEEQVVVSPSGDVVKNKVDVREHVAWKDALFIFNKRGLESIMTDLARWYEFTASYEDDALRRAPFSGYLKRYDNIDDFLELLRETGELDYTIRERHIVFFKR